MLRSFIIIACALLASCGGNGSSSVDAADQAVPDALPDRAADAGPELMPGEVDADVAPDAPPDQLPGDAADADGPTLPPLPTQDPLAVPEDPLAGKEEESCAVYLEARCTDGKAQQCDIFDPASQTFVEAPDPLLRRAYLFDRWRDLYNSPDGQAVDRDFLVPVPPGTPESEWGKAESFKCYCGSGDGGIWTGWATVAAILRYSQTGTEADYLRMEQQVRDMVTDYDVTGIPGYLCRYHFLLLPAGGPNDPDHILRWEDRFTKTTHDRDIPDVESIPNLPAIYTEGVKDKDGKVWKGKPMWHGRPSIDQNTGPMTSLPMAYGLLKDEALKERIAHHLTCYLKRLRRVELINLQANPELVQGLMAYFSVGELHFDPDDIDLTKADRIVGYVHVQINTVNEATYDKSCPDHVQIEPWRVIDAASDTFLLDMLELVMDMDTEDARPNQIDHYYFPSLRGGDAMHLMHLAAIAYHFTGDEQYREFLYDELIGNLQTDKVAQTAGAFDLPKFCKKFFGDQITFGPWWAFLELLGDCPLRTDMQQAYHDEMWDKLVKPAGNVDFDIMYAGAVPPAIATDRGQALTYALDQLAWMGGNGGLPSGSPDDPKWLDEPRRAYTTTPDMIMAWTPDGIDAVCPTQHEIDVCTAKVEVMGIDLGNLTGWNAFACTGSAWECEVGDGKCVRKEASGPLPVHLRNHTDYLWQRDPFELGAGASFPGERQFAGSDYSVPYWNARRYGFVTAGAGQVLAWRDVGSCPPDPEGKFDLTHHLELPASEGLEAVAQIVLLLIDLYSNPGPVVTDLIVELVKQKVGPGFAEYAWDLLEDVVADAIADGLADNGPECLQDLFLESQSLAAVATHVDLHSQSELAQAAMPGSCTGQHVWTGLALYWNSGCNPAAPGYDGCAKIPFSPAELADTAAPIVLPPTAFTAHAESSDLAFDPHAVPLDPGRVALLALNCVILPATCSAGDAVAFAHAAVDCPAMAAAIPSALLEPLGLAPQDMEDFCDQAMDLLVLPIAEKAQAAAGNGTLMLQGSCKLSDPDQDQTTDALAEGTWSGLLLRPGQPDASLAGTFSGPAVTP
jgi:hypothetical protein